MRRQLTTLVVVAVGVGLLVGLGPGRGPGPEVAATAGVAPVAAASVPSSRAASRPAPAGPRGGAAPAMTLDDVPEVPAGFEHLEDLDLDLDLRDVMADPEIERQARLAHMRADAKAGLLAQLAAEGAEVAEARALLALAEAARAEAR